MLLIDDYTCYTTIYILKRKSEALQAFKNREAHVERQHHQKGYKIMKLQTDNGGEYTSNAFKTHLQSLVVEHQPTMSYTPQQNGVSECANRTIAGRVRSMMSDAGLPSVYWALAATTAVHIKNCTPTKALVGNTTPYELWSGERANLADF